MSFICIFFFFLTKQILSSFQSASKGTDGSSHWFLLKAATNPETPAESAAVSCLPVVRVPFESCFLGQFPQTDPGMRFCVPVFYYKKCLREARKGIGLGAESRRSGLGSQRRAWPQPFGGTLGYEIHKPRQRRRVRANSHPSLSPA